MPAEEDYDVCYKITVCGDVSVGKTHIWNRVIEEKLPSAPGATLGVAFGTKLIRLSDGTTVKCRLWDTAGQERFRATSAMHFRRAQGCLIVYDLTNHQSFINAATWLTAVHEHAEPDTEIMLVGNKYDLVENDPSKRQVPYETAAHFAQKSGMAFIEVSALSKYNVDHMMKSLLQSIHDKANEPPPDTITGKVGPAALGEAGRTNRFVEKGIRLEADERANVIRPNENGCCALG